MKCKEDKKWEHLLMQKAFLACNKHVKEEKGYGH